jgi:hypothetical protein
MTSGRATLLNGSATAAVDQQSAAAIGSITDIQLQMQ